MAGVRWWCEEKLWWCQTKGAPGCRMLDGEKKPQWTLVPDKASKWEKWTVGVDLDEKPSTAEESRGGDSGGHGFVREAREASRVSSEASVDTGLSTWTSGYRVRMCVSAAKTSTRDCCITESVKTEAKSDGNSKW